MDLARFGRFAIAHIRLPGLARRAASTLHTCSALGACFALLACIEVKPQPPGPSPHSARGSRLQVDDDGSDGGSEARRADGKPCADDADCKGGHCGNHVCCSAGDCCRAAEDCPGFDAERAVCDDPARCQGSRSSVRCTAQFSCLADDPVADDSACGTDIEAAGCGLYASRFCNGAAQQFAPRCPTSCSDDTDCDEQAHCHAGACAADLPVAGDCRGDEDCASHHCSNGVCCESDDCCTTATDCDPSKYAAPATCDDPASCQGTRIVPACEDHRCAQKRVDDDSACDLGVVANDCGAGSDVKCPGGVDQHAPPPCASGTCFQDYECVRTAFCAAGNCTPDRANGEACTTPDMCQSGHCDTFCCAWDCCDSAQRCPKLDCTQAACTNSRPEPASEQP